MDDSKVKFFQAHCPALEELVPVLRDGLKEYFETVKVDIVECPDFKAKPYKLAVTGLNGKSSIADVGGVHQLIPRVNLESKYDLQTVTETIYKSSSDLPISVLGPGGGAFYNHGFCCEFMGSAKYNYLDSKVTKTDCASRYAYVDESNGLGRWKEQVGDDRFGLMGNFYLSQDKPGKVLKIHVSKRIAKVNYTTAIREVLFAKYGKDKPISMGGVFLINRGKAKLHIMPKHWPQEPSSDESVNNDWLKFYEITKHPLVCLSVFHSYDPGYDLRLEHTHCFNLDTIDEAGHYHYDITPETVEYEGYFNTAELVYRLDGPSHKK